MVAVAEEWEVGYQPSSVRKAPHSPSLVSHYTVRPSGLITLMVVAVIKASWLQTPLFVHLCFASIKTVFRMPVAQLPPPYVEM